MNHYLRLKINEKFITYDRFAAAAGINGSTVSKLISGTRKPTESQKAIIAKLLKDEPDLLFPDVPGSVSVKVTGVKKGTNGKSEH